MYAKGKRVVINNELITNIQKKFCNAIEHSDLIVLVGIKYIEHDDHIWTPILKSKTKILVVDPYPEDTIAWSIEHKLKEFSVIPRSFDEAIWEITKAVKSTALNY